MCAKILVVDDEPDIAKGWARALKIAGHDVIVAQEPSSAIQLSTENPVDLAVLDYMMPSMTGIELLNEIRKEHPFIRSIIVSGKIDFSLTEESILSDIRADVEADVYLHKPVENNRLRETVTELLSKPIAENWQAVAKANLEPGAPLKRVRSIEKKLNKKKNRRR